MKNLQVLFFTMSLTSAWELSAAPENEIVLPSFKLIRYEEDYSALKNKLPLNGLENKIKYLELSKNSDAYVSLGGEIRERYQNIQGFDFALNKFKYDDYLLHRILLNADVHLNQQVRGFIQIANHDVFSKANTKSAIEENQLDLQQAFVEFSTSQDNINFSLRAGRQEMRFGSDRLVSVRNNPNVRRSFGAARLGVKTKNLAVDAFYAIPLELRDGVFDDREDENQRFWGIYTASNKPVLPLSDAKIDVYYLGLDRENSIYTQGTADERRHTIGARAWTKRDALDYNFEFAYQFGKFGQSNINAWTLASDTGYRWTGLPLKPRLGLKLNVISGDDNPNDSKLETFNPLFPNLTYFSENALVVPANLFNIHPSLNLQVTPNLDITAGWDFLWRYSTKDAFYVNPFRPLAGTAQSKQRYIGSELNMDLNWQINRNLQLSTSYVHFFASDLIHATGGMDVDFFMLMAGYRF